MQGEPNVLRGLRRDVHAWALHLQQQSRVRERLQLQTNKVEQTCALPVLVHEQVVREGHGPQALAEAALELVQRVGGARCLRGDDLDDGKQVL